MGGHALYTVGRPILSSLATRICQESSTSLKSEQPIRLFHGSSRNYRSILARGFSAKDTDFLYSARAAADFVQDSGSSANQGVIEAAIPQEEYNKLLTQKLIVEAVYEGHNPKCQVRAEAMKIINQYIVGKRD